MTPHKTVIFCLGCHLPVISSFYPLHNARVLSGGRGMEFGKLSGLQTNNANIQYFTPTLHTCKNKNKSLNFFLPHLNPCRELSNSPSTYQPAYKNKKHLPKNSISVISVMQIKTKMGYYYVLILILK